MYTHICINKCHFYIRLRSAPAVSDFSGICILVSEKINKFQLAFACCLYKGLVLALIAGKKASEHP
jgi:hypothetical protein